MIITNTIIVIFITSLFVFVVVRFSARPPEAVTKPRRFEEKSSFLAIHSFFFLFLSLSLFNDCFQAFQKLNWNFQAVGQLRLRQPKQKPQNLPNVAASFEVNRWGVSARESAEWGRPFRRWTARLRRDPYGTYGEAMDRYRCEVNIINSNNDDSRKI